MPRDARPTEPARLAATGPQAALGQTAVVENRADASSSVAIEVVARAAPGGLTVFFASNALMLNAVVHPNLPYVLLNSFAPVSTFCSVPNLFWCATDQPWRDLEASPAMPIPARNSLHRPQCRISWDFATRIRTEVATWREIAWSLGVRAE